MVVLVWMAAGCEHDLQGHVRGLRRPFHRSDAADAPLDLPLLARHQAHSRHYRGGDQGAVEGQD